MVARGTGAAVRTQQELGERSARATASITCLDPGTNPRRDLERAEDPDDNPGRLLDSAKWSLWHGNVHKSLERLDTLIELIEHDPRVQDGPERQKLSRTLNELTAYLESNRHLIPNYGDRRRHGEAISSSIAESTVNQVISRRFVKKQQMRWQPDTAHLLLQVRTRMLNGTLRETFQRWWPAMTPNLAPALS